MSQMRVRTRAPSSPPRTLRGGRGLTIALLAFGLLALTGAPAALRAQEAPPPGEERIDTPYRWIPRGFRLGMQTGYVDASRTALGNGLGSTAAFGGRARVRISSPISLEGGLFYGSSDRLMIDPRLPSGPAAVDTVGTQWLMAEAVVQVALTGARTWHGIQPYVLGGVGLMLGLSEEDSPAFTGADEADFEYQLNTAPQIEVGLGAEWIVSDRWGLGFEFRDHLWRIKPPPGFFDPQVLERIGNLGLEAPQESDWTHNLGFTVTLWRYF